jgi:hypothetical protein
MRTDAINNRFMPTISSAILNLILDDAQTRAFNLTEHSYKTARVYQFTEDDPLGNKTMIELSHYASPDHEFFMLRWTAPDAFDFGEFYSENRLIEIKISKAVFDYAIARLIPHVIRQAA